MSLTLRQEPWTQSPFEALSAELDTAWAPDPWCYADLLDREPRVDSAPSNEDLSVVSVPFVGGRSRTVPWLGPFMHARLDRLAFRAAIQAEPFLSEGVFGYRPLPSGLWAHYRSALRRRFEMEDRLAARHKYAAKLDLKKFFPSIESENVRAFSGYGVSDSVVEDLIELLSIVAAKSGYMIPEGYSFARSLANLSLIPLDQSIALPFVRWIDDYTIFSDSVGDLEAEITRFERIVLSLGLQVAQEKTRVGPAETVVSARSGSLVEMHPIPVSRSPGTGVTSKESPGSERQLRYAVRVATERKDRELLLVAAGLAKGMPESLYPRLAWYLATLSRDPDAAAAMSQHLERHHDHPVWAYRRLVAALWYFPTPLVERHRELLLDLATTMTEVYVPAARVFARHLPAELSSLPSARNEGEERAIQLATLESQSGTRQPAASSLDWFSPGPPVKSYL